VGRGGCPWFPDGMHRNGCGCNSGAPNEREQNRRGKQAAKYEKRKDRVDDSVRRNAEEYVRKNGRTLFTTYTPPGTGGMPPGVHMEEVEWKGDKAYRIVLD
jgi:hypothetical protein